MSTMVLYMCTTAQKVIWIRFCTWKKNWHQKFECYRLWNMNFIGKYKFYRYDMWHDRTGHRRGHVKITINGIGAFGRCWPQKQKSQCLHEGTGCPAGRQQLGPQWPAVESACAGQANRIVTLGVSHLASSSGASFFPPPRRSHCILSAKNLRMCRWSANILGV